ncbi:MAG: radical SAM protein [bacterium]
MLNKLPEEKFTYTPSFKEKDAIPLWFCFPSTYMIGMASLGFLNLFRILDQNKNVFPERIFTDTEKTFHNVKNIEMIGFSFSFELDFLGMFKILEKHNIPLRSKDRGDHHPLIFGGGPVLTANPEPYADFFDVIVIGEGEEILIELINEYKIAENLKNKQEKLLHLVKIQSIYVPSLYNIEYNSDNTIKTYIKNYPELPQSLKKRCIKNLSNCIYSPIITEKSMFSGMFLIETARGCPKKCRFCLASYLNLPARYPDYKNIIDAIDTALDFSNKIGLLGALITEHPDFEKICEYILDKRKKQQFELSMSSLRADKMTPLIVKTLKQCGQRQITIAVEAGSERLRKFINKQLSEKDIVENVKTAGINGLSGLKIYGIIGLPTETQQDIDELICLITKLKQENKSLKLTLSISSFVPKAHTPFQWEKREKNSILQEKSDYLKRELYKNKILFKPTSIKWDYIQAVLSRGDRRLSSLLERVYRYNGSLGSWGRAFKELKTEINIPELDWYALRQRTYEEILPWDFIDVGLSRQTLRKEHERAYL